MVWPKIIEFKIKDWKNGLIPFDFDKTMTNYIPFDASQWDLQNGIRFIGSKTYSWFIRSRKRLHWPYCGIDHIGPVFCLLWNWPRTILFNSILQHLYLCMKPRWTNIIIKISFLNHKKHKNNVYNFILEGFI